MSGFWKIKRFAFFRKLVNNNNNTFPSYKKSEGLLILEPTRTRAAIIRCNYCTNNDNNNKYVRKCVKKTTNSTTIDKQVSNIDMN